MKFRIEIFFQKVKYRYNVEKISEDLRSEKYKVTAKNKSIILINDRPTLKAYNLKHWKMKWKLEGLLWNNYFLELIIEAIEKKIS